ncbi:MAG: hypothetical protein MUF51_08465 [Vicinamibacteria bacterium]|nr:hypothetical protein [Vicinamibacteria bacterium]
MTDCFSLTLHTHIATGLRLFVMMSLGLSAAGMPCHSAAGIPLRPESVPGLRADRLADENNVDLLVQAVAKSATPQP